MTKEELIEKLNDIYHTGGDEEVDHVKADNLLLEYIDCPDVTKIFNNIEKWYA